MVSSTAESRQLTKYELSCGDIQWFELNQTRITLTQDSSPICYRVHHHCAGLAMGQGYINYTQSYITLTEARRAYAKLVKYIKAGGY